MAIKPSSRERPLLSFKSQPDSIVIEFGDGVYGEYGVMKILQDKEIQKILLRTSAVHMTQWVRKIGKFVLTLEHLFILFPDQ